MLWEFIHDVASGLAYLHSQTPPIIHQDIKPDNILIARNGEFVITDFGISQQARSTLRRSSMHLSSAGSVAYMGPERFSKQYNSVKASDVWSLGVTIYELAVGELPFCGMGGSMQKQGADIPDLPDTFSNELNMVMQSCLAKDTWNRPTAAQLAEYAAQKKKNEIPNIPWTLPEGFEEFSSRAKGEPIVDKSNKTNSASFENKTIPMKKGGSEVDFVQEQNTSSANSNYSSMNTTNPEQSNGLSWLYWVLSVVGGLATGVIINLLLK